MPAIPHAPGIRPVSGLNLENKKFEGMSELFPRDPTAKPPVQTEGKFIMLRRITACLNATALALVSLAPLTIASAKAHAQTHPTVTAPKLPPAPPPPGH